MAQFDLFRLLGELQRLEVSYVLIGGVAAVARGAPVATFDLDICYEKSAPNLERLVAVLRSLNARLRGAPEDVPFLLDAATIAAGDHFTFVTDRGDFDIMATPAGTEGYEALRANSSEMDLGGFRVFVAAIDDLLRMKRVAGREKDMTAIAHLEAIRDELGGR